MTWRRSPTALLLFLVAVLLGALLFVSTASGASTPNPTFPKSAFPTGAQFVIPASIGRTWALRLWSEGRLLGVAQGVSGVLSVPISTPTCQYQADVRILGVHGRSYWVSGSRTQAARCRNPAGPSATS
jgi:hypothetical protein